MTGETRNEAADRDECLDSEQKNERQTWLQTTIEIMAQLGFRTLNEMVGQVQKLDRKKAINHYKAAGIDLTPILHQVDVPAGTKFYNTQKQVHNVDKSIEFEIIEKANPS